MFRPRDSSDIDPALLRRITTALRHRGPDGEGFHIEPGVGLGHRRLAIIDVDGGQQPMYNEDETVVIVFNGEIYNFSELRPKLQALGHIFRNRCDTEAIIHACESWGPDCLQHLNGMFAFALWDRNRNQLFIARDRLGKKPLYYATTDDGTVVFASELTALGQVPGLRRRIDPARVDDFFAFGYVPDPHSIYAGIQKLPAAHYLLFDRHAGTTQPARYGRGPSKTQPMDEAPAAAELISRLRDATARRLVADVPLGAFLSGGVDSSAVGAIAAGLRAAPLDTFTIGFAGAEDETPFADKVAQRYGTVQHNETAAELDYISAARLQGRIFGEPFGDSSAVPTFKVCALTRRHATVALSGDGGDEVFAGYRRYQWHRITEAVRALLPGPIRHTVIGQLARVYPKLDRAPRWLRAKHTLTEISLDSALGYYRMIAKTEDRRRRSLFSPRLQTELDGYDPSARIPALMEECGSDDPLLQAQYADLQTWLSGGILTKVDRVSMANGLEVRAPFLDHEVVAWGLALPSALKLRRGVGKYLLKRGLAPYVPREVLYRPKQGFASSLAPCFRAARDRLRHRLLGDIMLSFDLFSPQAIAQLIDEHSQGRFDHSGVLWLLLVFEGFLATELTEGEEVVQIRQKVPASVH
jgi:asparagine synthase (glutamine-hydrolysing)